MKMNRFAVFVCVCLCAMLAGCKSSESKKNAAASLGSSSMRAAVEGTHRGQEYSMRTVIVSLAEELPDEAVQQLADDFDMSVMYNYHSFNMCALTASKDLSESELSDLIDRLSADKRVLNVERDYVIQLDDKL